MARQITAADLLRSRSESAITLDSLANSVWNHRVRSEIICSLTDFYEL